jgi:hypothetical protein
MVEAYRSIGKRIVEEELHGENILKELSKEPTEAFGKVFFYANVYNMRQFYLVYNGNNEIFYTHCV